MNHSLPPLSRAFGVLAIALAAAGAACRSPGAQPSGSARANAAPDDFDRSAERAPSIDTLHSVAHVMAAQGRDDECKLVLEKLIDTHPRFLPAYAELAELYLRRDEPESARSALEAGLSMTPEDAVLRNNLGLLDFFDSKYEQALEHFAAAAASDPADARCRANLAAALGMLGRADEALAAYYLIVPPAEAHHNLGVLCQTIGNTERAKQEFALARELRDR
jgi:Flp pilus assembly protein TadD